MTVTRIKFLIFEDFNESKSEGSVSHEYGAPTWNTVTEAGKEEYIVISYHFSQMLACSLDQ